MALQITAALKNGFRKLASRAGALLTLAYVVTFVVYQLAFNGVINAFYAGLDLEGVSETPSVQPALTGSLTVDGAVVLACLLVLSYLSVVAVRTFVADELDSIPAEFLTRRIPFVLANLVVGGIVFGIAVTVGTVLLFVPGIFLYVSLVFMTMYIAVEDENFLAALRDSWSLASGDRLAIFGLTVIVVVAAAVVGGVFGFGASIVTVAAGFGPGASSLLTVVVSAPMSTYQLAVLADAFNQLRAERGEGGAGVRGVSPDSPPSPA